VTLFESQQLTNKDLDERRNIDKEFKCNFKKFLRQQKYNPTLSMEQDHHAVPPIPKRIIK